MCNKMQLNIWSNETVLAMKDKLLLKYPDVFLFVGLEKEFIPIGKASDLLFREFGLKSFPMIATDKILPTLIKFGKIGLCTEIIENGVLKYG